MKLLKKGDIVFSNNGGKIVSVNVVLDKCYDSPNPFSGANDYWNKNGRKVNLIYFEIGRPIVFRNHKEFLLNHEEIHGPFDKNGNAKLGYLFEMSSKKGEYLMSLIDTNYKNQIYNFIETLNTKDH